MGIRWNNSKLVCRATSRHYYIKWCLLALHRDQAVVAFLLNLYIKFGSPIVPTTLRAGDPKSPRGTQRV